MRRSKAVVVVVSTGVSQQSLSLSIVRLGIFDRDNDGNGARRRSIRVAIIARGWGHQVARRVAGAAGCCCCSGSTAVFSCDPTHVP